MTTQMIEIGHHHAQCQCSLRILTTLERFVLKRNFEIIYDLLVFSKDNFCS